MASLSLRHLSKTYDNGVNAIKDVTLEVDDKEFMVLAGSGGMRHFYGIKNDRRSRRYYRWRTSC